MHIIVKYMIASVVIATSSVKHCWTQSLQTTTVQNYDAYEDDAEQKLTRFIKALDTHLAMQERVVVKGVYMAGAVLEYSPALMAAIFVFLGFNQWSILNNHSRQNFSSRHLKGLFVLIPALIGISYCGTGIKKLASMLDARLFDKQWAMHILQALAADKNTIPDGVKPLLLQLAAVANNDSAVSLQACKDVKAYIKALRDLCRQELVRIKAKKEACAQAALANASSSISGDSAQVYDDQECLEEAAQPAL